MSAILLKICIQVISIFTILILELKRPKRLEKAQRFSVWKVNFSIGLLNTLIFVFFMNQLLFSVIEFTSINDIGLFNLMNLSLITKIICSVLLLDYVAYLWHIANHKYKILWRFHATHHSDEFMEASTAYRFHLGELLISFGIRVVTVYFFAVPLEGLFVFEVIYNFSNLFVHSDIKLNNKLEAGLSRLFVTPSMHEIHHSTSEEEYNSNYGTIFSIWDKMQNTFTNFKMDQKITLGLKQFQNTNNVLKALLIPLTSSSSSGK